MHSPTETDDMSANGEGNVVEQETAFFFTKNFSKHVWNTTNTRGRSYIGGDVTTVPVQGNSSYTVYAGTDADPAVLSLVNGL